jgi:hypothetical protein
VKGKQTEVISLDESVDEIHVFEGMAERTGNRVERAGVRGRRGFCRSIRDLGAKSRRFGDGYYYLTSTAWPADATAVSLKRG